MGDDGEDEGFERRFLWISREVVMLELNGSESEIEVGREMGRWEGDKRWEGGKDIEDGRAGRI